MFVNFNILNQLGSPAINSNTFANRPAAGQTGRLFVSTDTYEIYRDNGTTWDLIGGPGSSTITGSGTATQVAYFTSSQAIGSSANLFWDNTNGFLGVATATPSARIEAVKTDGIGIYANFTTNAGSGSSTTGLWAKNVTNSSGFAAVIEETTPNTTAGQYPLLIKHSLSSGTAGVGMGTGLHFQLPDDAGTFKTTQLTIETINAAAATYATRYRFNVQSNGSSTPVAYINATGVGIFTATPGAALDVHSTGTIAQFNTTSATGNTYIAFQRTGTGLWRVGDTYNGGPNQFEIHNTVLGIDAVNIKAATNKTSWQATENYTSGVARGNYFDYNLTLNPANPLASPNAISAVGASLDLTLQGSIIIPSGARSGLDAYNSISFTTTGTLTHNQGTQIRAYSNLTAGWAFNGSATGTITHLAGLHALFPDNTGSAIAITNNYALLLNDQTANTGTVTYTNRWGVYQEGASDLNYMAANLLLGSTTNNGNRLQITGNANITNTLSIGTTTAVAGLLQINSADTTTAAHLQVIDLTTTLGNSIVANFRNASDGNGKYAITAWQVQNSSGTDQQSFIGSQAVSGASNFSPNMIFGVRTGASTYVERMRLDNIGNLGLGLTPSAWGSLFKVYQNIAGSFFGYSTTDTGLVLNAYNDNSNWRYVNSAAAALYQQAAGAHIWYNAPSGTAGNAITFTQAMTLDTNGILAIGKTPTTGFVGYRLQVGSASDNQTFISIINSSTGTGVTDGLSIGNDTTGADIYQRENQPLRIHTNNTNRIQIQGGGNVLIGTTTDAGQKLQVNGVVATEGVKFPATQVASADVNTLDDYEEGTWTPDLESDGQVGTFTISTQTGNYTKIGNTVYCDFIISWTAIPGTGARWRLTGLPFTYNATRPYNGITFSYITGVPKTNGLYAQLTPTGGGLRSAFNFTSDGDQFINVTTGNNISATGTIQGSFFYRV